MGRKTILIISLITVLLMSVISFDDVSADKDEKKEKLTKLQKECQKEFENKDPQKYSKECELLFLINENNPNPQADSFFDVFFDVFTIDSFFDIFTELQESTTRSDSFFDVFFDVYTIDSFFDIFTELQTDVDHIQTEIVALDLRGQSCPPNQFIVGIDTFGDIVCQSISTPIPECSAVNSCSNHGICVADNTCQCDIGFSGSDCSVPDTQCNAPNCVQCTSGIPNMCEACSSGFFMDSTGQCTLRDNDRDGFTNDVDCNDNNPNVNPSANELPGNNIDDNCNGVIDELACNPNTNPTCNTATILGSVSGDSGTSSLSVTNFEENWYRVFVSEEDSSLTSPHDLGVRVTLVSSPGTDYDLYLYCDNCGGTPSASSTLTGGTDTAFMKWEEDTGPFDIPSGSDSGRTIIIEVRHVSSTSCGGYTLTVQGNVQIGPNTCPAK